MNGHLKTSVYRQVLSLFCLCLAFVQGPSIQDVLRAQTVDSGTNPAAGPSTNAPSGASRKPPVRLEEALAKAKAYMHRHKLSTAGLSLVLVYYSKYPDQKNNGWTLIWAPDDPHIVDGELRVYVNDGGKITHGGSA